MITIILGTKAQLIKMAPVMKAMQEHGVPYQFVHTGQHRETMEEMYLDFGIKSPDLKLYNGPDIISVKQMVVWFVRLLGMAIFQRKRLFGDSEKGIVLVHGDTLSTLLGALLGRMAGMKVGHIESGLRSFNYFHPFPEEITRVLVFRLSHILFCPGEWAASNLIKFNKEIVNTGANTLVDTIRISKTGECNTVEQISSRPFSLVSLHRYENIFKREKLSIIVKYLEEIAEKHYLVFVLHPPTEKQLVKFGLFAKIKANENIACVARMHHSIFLRMLQSSKFVITDGGSLQEETAYLGIPCLLFRETTERQEGLGENVVLSSFNGELIREFVNSFEKLRNEADNFKLSPSEIIVENVKHYC